MAEFESQFSEQLIPNKKHLLQNPQDNHNYLEFPNFYESLKLTYDAYKVLESRLNITSESNRKLKAENFYFEEDANNIRKLSTIVIDFLAKNYTGKPNYDEFLDENSKIRFWNKVELNLTLTEIININSDIYWKRYYRELNSNYKNNISLERLSCKDFNWKEITISLKLSNYLENANYEEWFEEKEENLMKLLDPWVKKIKITKLKSMKLYSFERDPHLLDYQMKNYNSEDCHHINLKVISNLTNLTELNLEFSPPQLGMFYERRLFFFSTQDVQNLALGLESLEKLKILHFGRCDWNLKKLKELIPKLRKVPIEDLQFKYCNLKDDCAYILSKILEHNTFLKHLRLTGNKFSDLGMSAISYGIQEFKGELITLDISRNPIFDNGILFLGRALHNSPKQIKYLNVSSIEITEKGAKFISNIIKFHHNLLYLNMMALPVGEKIGKSLVTGLEENHNLLHLDSRDCELSHKQEVMIKVLLERNNYIRNNPYVNKREEYKMNTNFPTEWNNRIKNPILLKVLNEIENKRQFRKLRDNLVIEIPENFPNFIPKEVRTQRDCMEFIITDLLNQRLKKLKKKKGIIFKDEYSREKTENNLLRPENLTKLEFFEYFGKKF